MQHIFCQNAEKSLSAESRFRVRSSAFRRFYFVDILELKQKDRLKAELRTLNDTRNVTHLQFDLLVISILSG